MLEKYNQIFQNDISYGKFKIKSMPSISETGCHVKEKILTYIMKTCTIGIQQPLKQQF